MISLSQANRPLQVTAVRNAGATTQSGKRTPGAQTGPNSEPLKGHAPHAGQAGSWDRERRVIAKAEHNAHGANPRYVVTSLEREPQPLYEEDYCARGEAENRIKEQQLDLFSDRTSCHEWWPNQFRLLLSSFAYVLVESLRRVGLAGTELARAQAGTLRLKLLKVGAVVVRNRRRVRLWFSSAFPLQALFRHCVACFYG